MTSFARPDRGRLRGCRTASAPPPLRTGVTTSVAGPTSTLEPQVPSAPGRLLIYATRASASIHTAVCTGRLLIYATPRLRLEPQARLHPGDC